MVTVNAQKPLIELTWRCVVLSIILTLLLAMSNAYLALKLGLLTSASIPAAIISMGVLRLFKNASILEHNAVQTAASAGEAIAGGIVYTIPALIIIGYWQHFDYVTNVLIALSGGILGVLFSIPLRRILVNDAHLSFPEGKAIAAVLISSNEQIGLLDIAYGAMVGALLELSQTGFKVLASGWTWWFSVKRSVMCMGLGFSATMIGAGYLVGFDMACSIGMGALIACSILSGRILAPVMALPGLLVQHSHAVAAQEGLERLYTLESDNHGIAHPLVPTHIKGHYQLADVEFAYGQNPPVIVVPKLEIKPGERIAVVGPIGAGKSTLLRMLSGLYHPQKGSIRIDGLELGHVSRQLLSQKIGYLQQDHRLFQGTLRENLLIGLPDPGDEVLFAAMARTGMDRIVGSHPMGLERPIMEGGKGLSNGQKQLVAFTRLILCQPDILLLDEPTATMDDMQERQCMAVLAEEANAGKTLVIVTHKPGTLALVNRIIVVAGSAIVMDGPRDAVLQQLQQRPNAQAAS